MEKTRYITEPSKDVRICYEADICVIGGSCTGVFAAVRAARLGASVVIVEKQNCFGGVACSGLVNVWHSLHDTDKNNHIISGLTFEMIQRLEKSGAVAFGQNASNAYMFNPNELKIQLDNLIKENKIKAYLHSYYAGLICEEKAVTHVLIENKDGRCAIKAKFFIDATGDGDLARDLNIPGFKNKNIQPPSSCFLMQGNTADVNLNEMIKQHGEEFGVDDVWGWSSFIPNIKNIKMCANTRVFGVLCSSADDLTYAEIEGRRQADALTKMLKKYANPECEIVATCSQIGIRETVHYRTRFRANEFDLLTGKRYGDAILNGTYRIDIHHSDDNGITFKYLDGTSTSYYGTGCKKVTGNWKAENNIVCEEARYYQVPFDILVQETYENFIAVGRMMNADEGSFGALRVMVNLNQMGEASGVAAYLSIHRNKAIQKLEGVSVRDYLNKGGSAL